MSSERQRRNQRGLTLVEMVLAIVILGVGLSGVLIAFSTVTRGSADPVVTQQMLAIAEEMLEEIQLKPYVVAANTAPAAYARNTFNDVLDYNGYDTSVPKKIYTIDGTSVGSLDGSALRINVTVTRGSDSLTLTGWRTDFAS